MPAGITAQRSVEVDDHPQGRRTALVLDGTGKTGRRVVAQLQAWGQAT
jgi:hypothetical protein